MQFVLENKEIYIELPPTGWKPLVHSIHIYMHARTRTHAHTHTHTHTVEYAD